MDPVETVILDPVVALLGGRVHYRCEIPSPRGVPTVREIQREERATCKAAFLPVENREGQPIGYRCPSCGTTANLGGRTEWGPREITTVHRGIETRLVEPEVR